ncbi:ribonuclease E/G [Vibrio lentus]|nr:ribonuclease E/G [Vibrio lentus]
MVQVVKDPLGTKGARLTTDITLPSRYLVFMPESESRRCFSVLKANQNVIVLKSRISLLVDEYGGFIIRTAAEGADFHELGARRCFL